MKRKSRFSFKKETIDWFYKNHEMAQAVNSRASFATKFWRRINRDKATEFIKEVIIKEKEILDTKAQEFSALEDLYIATCKEGKKVPKGLKAEVLTKKETKEKIDIKLPKAEEISESESELKSPHNGFIELPEDLSETSVTIDAPAYSNPSAGLIDVPDDILEKLDNPLSRFERRPYDADRKKIPVVPDFAY